MISIPMIAGRQRLAPKAHLRGEEAEGVSTDGVEE